MTVYIRFVHGQYFVQFNRMKSFFLVYIKKQHGIENNLSDFYFMSSKWHTWWTSSTFKAISTILMLLLMPSCCSSRVRGCSGWWWYWEYDVDKTEDGITFPVNHRIVLRLLLISIHHALNNEFRKTVTDSMLFSFIHVSTLFCYPNRIIFSHLQRPFDEW